MRVKVKVPQKIIYKKPSKRIRRWPTFNANKKTIIQGWLQEKEKNRAVTIINQTL